MPAYKEKELTQQSFIQKMFGILPKENAIIEINNILAKNENQITSIIPDQILKIGEKYKTDLKQNFYLKLLELFRKYLLYCLAEEKISQQQVEELEHLKRILLLTDKDTQKIIEEEKEKVFNRHVKEIFNNENIDSFHLDSLNKLRINLLISEEKANDIYAHHARLKIEKHLKEAIIDKRYSPQEESALMELAKNLGINLKFDSETERLLAKYRKYWEIENGTLPTIPSDINLQKSETLHWKAIVSWQEQRKVTKRYDYYGPTARLKIAKGIYYRVGSLGVRPQTEDVWQVIDQGTLYLTNKRLIFIGEKGSKTIPINKILDFTPYTDGIFIQKDSGKSPFLEFSGDPEIFAMILSRIINEKT